jgi:hypothetical protein
VRDGGVCASGMRERGGLHHRGRMPCSVPCPRPLVPSDTCCACELGSAKTCGACTLCGCVLGCSGRCSPAPTCTPVRWWRWTSGLPKPATSTPFSRSCRCVHVCGGQNLCSCVCLLVLCVCWHTSRSPPPPVCVAPVLAGSTAQDPLVHPCTPPCVEWVGVGVLLCALCVV